MIVSAEVRSNVVSMIAGAINGQAKRNGCTVDACMAAIGYLGVGEAPNKVVNAIKVRLAEFVERYGDSLVAYTIESFPDLAFRLVANETTRLKAPTDPNSAVRMAAAKGYLSLCNVLLDNGWGVTGTSSQRSAHVTAMKAGREDVVLALLARTKDSDLKRMTSSASGKSLLKVAMTCMSAAVFDALMARAPSLADDSAIDILPGHHGAYFAFRLVERLRAHDVDSKGNNAFHVACSEKHRDVAVALVDVALAEMETVQAAYDSLTFRSPVSQLTPLVQAIRTGTLGAARLLLHPRIAHDLKALKEALVASIEFGNLMTTMAVAEVFPPGSEVELMTTVLETYASSRDTLIYFLETSFEPYWRLVDRDQRVQAVLALVTRFLSGGELLNAHWLCQAVVAVDPTDYAELMTLVLPDAIRAGAGVIVDAAVERLGSSLLQTGPRRALPGRDGIVDASAAAAAAAREEDTNLLLLAARWFPRIAVRLLHSKLHLPVTSVTSTGRTALHLAVDGDDVILTEELLRRGAAIEGGGGGGGGDSMTDSGSGGGNYGGGTGGEDEGADKVPSPLALACSSRSNRRVARFLVNAGADKLSGTPSALELAVKQGMVAVVEAMLVQLQAQRNAERVKTVVNRAFMLACAKGAMVQVFLRLGQLPLNFEGDDGDGQTPLHLLCSNGQTNAALRVISRSSNYDKPNKKQQTPLMLACQASDMVEVALELIKRGVAIDFEDADQTRAIHMACSQGRLEVVKALVDAGVDLTATDADGSTPIHLACKSGHKGAENIAMFLLQQDNVAEYKELFLAKGPGGNTPLHYAARGSLLLLAGAYVNDGELKAAINTKNDSRDTPLSEAIRNAQANVTALLLRHTDETEGLLHMVIEQSGTDFKGVGAELVRVAVAKARVGGEAFVLVLCCFFFVVERAFSFFLGKKGKEGGGSVARIVTCVFGANPTPSPLIPHSNSLPRLVPLFTITGIRRPRV